MTIADIKSASAIYPIKCAIRGSCGPLLFADTSGAPNSIVYNSKYQKL